MLENEPKLHIRLTLVSGLIRRIRRTGELLTYIRTLKMYGWEFLFSRWLMETRSAEVMHLTVWFYFLGVAKRNILNDILLFFMLELVAWNNAWFLYIFQTRKYLDAWCVFFWATTPTLFSFFTFGLFTLMGHQLDAATVPTVLLAYTYSDLIGFTFYAFDVGAKCQ